MIADLRRHIDGLDRSSKSIRVFGLQLGIVLMLVAAWLSYKGHTIWSMLLFIGLLLVSFSLFRVPALKYFYLFWMGFGFIISWIITRIILVAIFFFVFLPMGIVLKILRKDLLDERIDKQVSTYWTKHQAKLDKSYYLKRF